jgi:hypothetical protein
MGSIASGNFRADRKTPIDAGLALDLRQLIWLGAVQPGARRRGLMHWPPGASREYAATLAYVSDLREAPWLRLSYGVQHAEAAEQPIAQVEVYIALVTTPLHFGGGGRWWLRCPLVIDGQACAQRAQTLYLGYVRGTCKNRSQGVRWLKTIGCSSAYLC